MKKNYIAVFGLGFLWYSETINAVTKLGAYLRARRMARKEGKSLVTIRRKRI